MPGGPIIIDPLKGKIGNIENDHKAIAAKTAASKIEIAQGGYTPKTTPTTSEVSATINDTPNPPKTSSMATILDTNDKKVSKWKTIFRNPLSGGDTKPSIELGQAPYSPKTSPSIATTKASMVDVHNPPKTSSRATILNPAEDVKSAKGGIELGQAPYKSKTSFETVKLGEAVSGSAGEDVSLASKATSGASKILEVGGKVLSNPLVDKGLKVGGVVGVAAGFLMDPGNAAKDGYVQIGNEKIKTGPSAPNYYSDVGKALTDTYGPGWHATGSGYTRDLYVNGKVSGTQTVDTTNLQLTQKGVGSAYNITAAPGIDSVTSAENSSPNRQVEPKAVAPKAKVDGPTTPGTKVTASVDPVTFTGTAHQPAGWKSESSSNLKDQKTDQTVVIDGKQRKGVTVDIFADGKQVFHDSGGNIIGYKETGTTQIAGVNSANTATGSLSAVQGLPDYTKPKTTVAASSAATAAAARGDALNKEYGLGEYAKPSAATPAATTPTPSWQTSDVSPNLGGIGGSDLTAHGNTLALRDSKDGTKFIAQMSDGSYQSVDKLTGAVAGAGTWGDSQGGGVALNGVGNTPDNASAVGPAAVTNPQVNPAPDTVDRFVANHTTDAPVSAPPSSPPSTPTVAGAVGPAPSPSAYTGGAEVVEVKTLKNGATLTTTASGAQIEQLPGHSAYQVKAPDQPAAVNMAPTSAAEVAALSQSHAGYTAPPTPAAASPVASSVTILDPPHGALPTAGGGSITSADPTTPVHHAGGRMIME